MQCLYKTPLFRILGSGVFVSFPDNDLTSKKLCFEYSVTICKGSVMGAGSVVTCDIPSNVIAYGNPCKVRREITENDRINPIKL